jgi:hypothetical protein
MSALIKTQMICLCVALFLLGTFVQMGVKRGLLRYLEFDEQDFAPLKTVLIGVMICLAALLFRDIWVVLR